MLGVMIRRPCTTDFQELHDFFRLVITDTFIKEGIGDQVDDIQKEIETKKNYLKSDLASKGKKRYFLAAVYEQRIIGTIEYGPASDLIKTLTNRAYEHLVEVGTVFVHPEFQGKGVGNLLLSAICTNLKNNGIDEYCLDCGYNRALKIWRKKFGEPEYLFPDFWGMGHDHAIWKIRVEDCLRG